ncbi:MAG: right-handed parallel beta-helix repeat-containing protein, partial [Planctomycetes bacterium]|nr:right-handed parallel beta-helix repeat-containing protein [Planctomycetota bacterium]
VCGNKFVELGDSAVCLVGRSHLRHDLNYTCPFCGQEHCWNWDTPSEETPGDCRVSNNLIHHVGVFGKQTAGVFVSLADKITISHNHIHHVPRAAVCINDGLWGGHVIEFNDIHDTVLETGDHGPFNSWGREPFWCARQSHGPSSHPAGDVIRYARHTTVIRYNRFRDNRGWGIDLDDGSSNYHVHGNLCVGISIKLREGDLRLVENNIFINPANPACMHVGYENNSDRFLRNIIVTNTASENPERDVNFNPQASEGAVIQMAGVPSQGPLLKESDYNLFYTDVGHAFINILQRDGVRHRYSLDQWRRLGFDRHSAYGDPAFVAPEQGDYRVRPDSPAIGLGFQNFPMDRFGLLENFPAQWR